MARDLTRHASCLIMLLAFSLVVAAAGDALAEAVWYVDDDAPNDPGPNDSAVSDPGEDGSAEHPYDAIQEALNAASDGDTIIVRDGLPPAVAMRSRIWIEDLVAGRAGHVFCLRSQSIRRYNDLQHGSLGTLHPASEAPHRTAH